MSYQPQSLAIPEARAYTYAAEDRPTFRLACCDEDPQQKEVRSVTPRQAADVLRALSQVLSTQAGLPWKRVVNRVVMGGGRVIPSLAFDTLTDHLFDLLCEQGLVRASGLHGPLALPGLRVLEAFAVYGPAAHPLGAGLASEALSRLRRTYELS